MSVESDPLWYKDAIVYQLHVKSFFDSNDDGIGDFAGLTRRLDYLQSLGVTVLWLLPFYPSPLRDDGYDIADYRGVHPSYGTMADFRLFVREAHKRGLRVITELVINHTSDQHPWFQRARAAPAGSRYRDYYVWSDTNQRYRDARIIFCDTEKSNWAWDDVAGAYYWHRFYSHQPDLNFDNPAVVRSLTYVMKYWLDLGVDGLRLDAVPYLCEREGTNCENLPETHAILKRLRAEIDRSYSDRMLLAEANQWPEDVLTYFGDGDECQMAFHFPLMPRLYMAVAQEDRHPITDIMRQTPDIPENCQWAIFLRNHDELTLEMVSDRERDYLWDHYASDKRARLNLGIRRRLAPLLENDRPRINLLNSLLLSMPGTPILYYGDELGMGDNVYLGDRDGVRTPMQWSPDRNGGFSRADPAQLVLPPIQDPVYGFQAINVEAQSRATSSPLNYVRRLIAVRRRYQAFGRGRLTFLFPSNRKVLAYVRCHGDEIILCVVNLARSAQSVDLDLTSWRGRVPVELLGLSSFPKISDRPYTLTLQRHSFFWFSLADAATLEGGLGDLSETLPEFVTLVMRNGWNDLIAGRNRTELAHTILPRFLPTERWFGAKDRKIETVEILRTAVIPSETGDGWCLLLAETVFVDGGKQAYFLPLGLSWGPANADQRSLLLPQTLAEIRRFRAEGALHDAFGQSDLVLALVAAIRENQDLECVEGGTIQCRPTNSFGAYEMPDVPAVRAVGVEQSNSSMLIDDFAVLKIYRRPERGLNPEVEMGRYLTDRAGFSATPPLLGTIEFVDETGEPTALGFLAGFVRNQGDLWSYTLAYLMRAFDDAQNTQPLSVEAAPDPHALFLTLARQLGRRTGELHRALCPADESDPAFAPEKFTASDLRRWADDIVEEADRVLSALDKRIAADPPLDPETLELARALLGERATVRKRIDDALSTPIDTVRTRYHGDYHLGQVLVVRNDVAIIDFEGEPRRSMEERRQKHTPLRDIAGMVRSFDYAAGAASRRAGNLPAADHPVLERFCTDWRDRSIAAFLDDYRETVAGTPIWPSDPTEAEHLLDLAMLQKVFYEIGYELANRPLWLSIPLQGALALLGRASDQTQQTPRTI